MLHFPIFLVFCFTTFTHFTPPLPQPAEITGTLSGPGTGGDIDTKLARHLLDNKVKKAIVIGGYELIPMRRDGSLFLIYGGMQVNCVHRDKS